MNTSKEHIDFIRENGKFFIDCSTAIFSNEEIELLQKYGHWFHALTTGLLSPITELQKRFVAVANNEIDPCKW